MDRKKSVFINGFKSISLKKQKHRKLKLKRLLHDMRRNSFLKRIKMEYFYFSNLFSCLLSPPLLQLVVDQLAWVEKTVMYYKLGGIYQLGVVYESLKYGTLGSWLEVGEGRDSIFGLKSLVQCKQGFRIIRSNVKNQFERFF